MGIGIIREEEMELSVVGDGLHYNTHITATYTYSKREACVKGLVRIFFICHEEDLYYQ